MKEKLIEIGQEKITKAVNQFEGKAIDCLNTLTEQFINSFAEDVDNKLNGYKERLDNLLNKYYELEKENGKLRLEIVSLKQHTRNLQTGNKVYKQNQTKLSVEKLEELLKYIINSKWTKTVNVKHSPMQIIVNKINEMKNELKGEQNEEDNS